MELNNCTLWNSSASITPKITANVRIPKSKDIITWKTNKITGCGTLVYQCKYVIKKLTLTNVDTIPKTRNWTFTNEITTIKKVSTTTFIKQIFTYRSVTDPYGIPINRDPGKTKVNTATAKRSDTSRKYFLREVRYRA